MTFWRPLFVKEPRELIAADAAKKLEDLGGHSSAVLHWSGSPNDDDAWYSHHVRYVHPKKESTQHHLNVFRCEAEEYNGGMRQMNTADSPRRSGPKKIDIHDKPAAERRKVVENPPAPPPLSSRLKSSAGLWPWQQRDVELSNSLVRGYMAPVPNHAPVPASPRQHQHQHEYVAIGDTTPTRKQAHAAAEQHGRRTASASPRRHEVKLRIMELAKEFGV